MYSLWRHPLLPIRTSALVVVVALTVATFAAATSVSAEPSPVEMAAQGAPADDALVAASLAAGAALTGSTLAGHGAPIRGVYIPGAAQDLNVLSAFEALGGGPLGIVHWYQPWGGSNRDPWYQPTLDTAALRQVAAHGAVPLITWEATGAVASAGGRDPSRVASISSGYFDSYIDEWAAGLKAFGKTVYLRPFHEMNNPTHPWAYGTNGNTASDEVAAWRYLHERFRRLGANNVQWVWSPNTENSQVSFDQLYPGDSYVDWLGVDGYNGGTKLTWGGWLSPQQLFARSLASLVALNPGKPIMIAETSSVEQGGSKAEWIHQLLRDVPEAFPNVRAIVWFHADTTTRGEADWRVDTTLAAQQAFKDLT